MFRRIGNNSAVSSLHDTFRSLWEQHGFWTRSYIISAVAELDDIQPVTKRLLRNPSGFAKVLKIYYGEENANKFKQLLEQHLLIAADLVKYANEGNTQEADAAREKWYQNADDIAMLLSSINPYWDRMEWQDMLHEHLRLVEEEAADYITGEYAKSIDTFDRMEQQVLKMADYMTSGIQKQFNL